jgi:hypothetical protein
MHFYKAGRRALIAAILLSLAACAEPVRIGDASRPLMAPGEGLVAAAVVFSNPTQPSFMKPNRFLFSFEFVATDGRQDDLWLGQNYPHFISKNVRAKPDDTPPVLLLVPAKPGKYRLKQADVIEEGRFFILPQNPPEIEVVAGQVTYIGSYLMTYECSFKGVGVRTPRYFRMGVVNDFERDMNELKGLDQRLESVVVTNALVK